MGTAEVPLAGSFGAPCADSRSPTATPRLPPTVALIGRRPVLVQSPVAHERRSARPRRQRQERPQRAALQGRRGRSHQPTQARIRRPPGEGRTTSRMSGGATPIHSTHSGARGASLQTGVGQKMGPGPQSRSQIPFTPQTQTKGNAGNRAGTRSQRPRVVLPQPRAPIGNPVLAY